MHGDPREKSGMSEQKNLFYKITGYIVISNLSYDFSQRMKNRSRPGPSLKIYNQAKVTETTEMTPADETPDRETDLYR